MQGEVHDMEAMETRLIVRFKCRRRLNPDPGRQRKNGFVQWPRLR